MYCEKKVTCYSQLLSLSVCLFVSAGIWRMEISNALTLEMWGHTHAWKNCKWKWTSKIFYCRNNSKAPSFYYCLIRDQQQQKKNALMQNMIAWCLQFWPIALWQIIPWKTNSKKVSISFPFSIPRFINHNPLDCDYVNIYTLKHLKETAGLKTFDGHEVDCPPEPSVMNARLFGKLNP